MGTVVDRIRDERPTRMGARRVQRFDFPDGTFVRGIGRVTATGEAIVTTMDPSGEDDGVASDQRVLSEHAAASGSTLAPNPLVPSLDGLADPLYWMTNVARICELPTSLLVFGGVSGLRVRSGIRAVRYRSPLSRRRNGCYLPQD